jgi:hypothetical protein
MISVSWRLPAGSGENFHLFSEHFLRIDDLHLPVAAGQFRRGFVLDASSFLLRINDSRLPAAPGRFRREFLLQCMFLEFLSRIDDYRLQAAPGQFMAIA